MNTKIQGGLMQGEAPLTPNGPSQGLAIMLLQIQASKLQESASHPTSLSASWKVNAASNRKLSLEHRSDGGGAP